MKNIVDIYKDYNIPPWLQMHQYRVAAVAATLFDAHIASGGLLTGRNEIISAGLLHDMGNIAKFNFESPVLPMTDEEKIYWKEVQISITSRYGVSAHAATLAIIAEIGVSPRIREIIDSISFSTCDEIEKSSDMPIKIMQYADMRVVPAGVVSLDARVEDMYVRYAHKRKRDDARIAQLVEAMKKIERSLFSGLPLMPADITETSVAALRDSFVTFSIAEIKLVR